MRDKYGYFAIDGIWLGLKQFSCVANTSDFEMSQQAEGIWMGLRKNLHSHLDQSW